MKFGQVSKNQVQEKATTQFDKAQTKFLVHPRGQSKTLNWFDTLKDTNDPDTLYDFYIKNLKAEIDILNTKVRQIKGKLGILHKNNAKNIDVFHKVISYSLENTKKKKAKLGLLPSDFAKYPTNLEKKGQSIKATDEAVNSRTFKVEYIKELELLIEGLKQQLVLLEMKLQETQIEKNKRDAIKPIVQKIEGFDLQRSTSSNQPHKLLLKIQFQHSGLIKQKKTIPSQDNTIQDRIIQNLLEEKRILEEQLKSIDKPQKHRSASSKTKNKIEGYDYELLKKINSPSTVMFSNLMN